MFVIYEDVLVEHLVKHKPTVVNILIKIGAILLGLVVTLTAWLITPTYSYLLFTAAWVAAYFLFTFQNYEYEYIYSSGDLYIDRITAKRRRKRLLSVSMDSVVLLAPCDEAHEHLKNTVNPVKTADCSPSRKDENRWFLVAKTSAGDQSMLIFSPSERMLTELRKALKDKVRA